MAGPFSTFQRISKILNFIAGLALTLMIFLTVGDILLRSAGRPFVGTYEIVSLLLALVIGFAIPQVSLDRGHVNMEFLLSKFSRRGKAVMNTVTRVMCLLLFFFIGYNLFFVGAAFHASGEVSATIQVPFYPVAYGVGVCALLECFVFIFDIVKIWRGQYE